MKTLLAISILFAANSASARCRNVDEGLTQLRLAQLYVNEAGPHSDADHRAIFHVLLRRQERLSFWLQRPVSFAETICRYSRGRLEHTRDRLRRTWVNALTADGVRPSTWPSHIDWENDYRATWLSVYSKAGIHLQEAPVDPCPGAYHWGGRPGVDDPDHGSDLRLLRCEEQTQNRFWTIAGL